MGLLTYFTSPLGTVFWTVEAGTDIATLGPFVYRNQFAAGLMASSVVAAGSRTGAALCAAEATCPIPPHI